MSFIWNSISAAISGGSTPSKPPVEASSNNENTLHNEKAVDDDMEVSNTNNISLSITKAEKALNALESLDTTNLKISGKTSKKVRIKQSDSKDAEIENLIPKVETKSSRGITQDDQYYFKGVRIENLEPQRLKLCLKELDVKHGKSENKASLVNKLKVAMVNGGIISGGKSYSIIKALVAPKSPETPLSPLEKTYSLRSSDRKRKRISKSIDLYDDEHFGSHHSTRHRSPIVTDKKSPLKSKRLSTDSEIDYSLHYSTTRATRSKRFSESESQNPQSSRVSLPSTTIKDSSNSNSKTSVSKVLQKVKGNIIKQKTSSNESEPTKLDSNEKILTRNKASKQPSSTNKKTSPVDSHGKPSPVHNQKPGLSSPVSQDQTINSRAETSQISPLKQAHSLDEVNLQTSKLREDQDSKEIEISNNDTVSNHDEVEAHDQNDVGLDRLYRFQSESLYSDEGNNVEYNSNDNIEISTDARESEMDENGFYNDFDDEAQSSNPSKEVEGDIQDNEMITNENVGVSEKPEEEESNEEQHTANDGSIESLEEEPENKVDAYEDAEIEGSNPDEIESADDEEGEDSDNEVDEDESNELQSIGVEEILDSDDNEGDNDEENVDEDEEGNWQDANDDDEEQENESTLNSSTANFPSFASVLSTQAKSTLSFSTNFSVPSSEPVSATSSGQPASFNPVISDSPTHQLKKAASDMAARVMEKFLKGQKLVSAMTGAPIPVDDDRLSEHEYSLFLKLLEQNKPLSLINKNSGSSSAVVIQSTVPSNEIASKVVEPKTLFSEISTTELLETDSTFASPAVENSRSWKNGRSSVGATPYRYRNVNFDLPSASGKKHSLENESIEAERSQVKRVKINDQAESVFRKPSLVFSGLPIGPNPSRTQSTPNRVSFASLPDEIQHNSMYAGATPYKPAQKKLFSMEDSSSNSNLVVQSYREGGTKYVPTFKDESFRFSLGVNKSGLESRSSSKGTENKSLTFLQRRRLQRQAETATSQSTSLVAKRILETLNDLTSPGKELSKTRPPKSSNSKDSDSIKESDSKAPLVQIKPAEKAQSSAPFGALVFKENSKPMVPIGSASNDNLKSQPPILSAPTPSVNVSKKQQNSEFTFRDSVNIFVTDISSADVDISGIKYVFSSPGVELERNLVATSKSKVTSIEQTTVSKSTSVSTQPATSTPGSTSATQSNNIWKVSTDKIKCQVCLVPNEKTALKCVSCENPLSNSGNKTASDKPVSSGWGAPVSSTPSSFVFGVSASTSSNSAQSALPSSGGFSFGSIPKPASETTETSTSLPASGGFSFGTTSKPASENIAPSSAQPASGGFSFGSTSKPASENAAPSSAQPASGGFSFGTTSKPASENIAPPTGQSASGGFSFGTTSKPASENAAPSSAQPASGGFSFGTTSKPASENIAPPTGQSASGGFSFGSISKPVSDIAPLNPLSGTGKVSFQGTASAPAPDNVTSSKPSGFSFGDNKSSESIKFGIKTTEKDNLNVSKTATAKDTVSSTPALPAFSTSTPSFGFGSPPTTGFATSALSLPNFSPLKPSVDKSNDDESRAKKGKRSLEDEEGSEAPKKSLTTSETKGFAFGATSTPLSAPVTSSLTAPFSFGSAAAPALPTTSAPFTFGSSSSQVPAPFQFGAKSESKSESASALVLGAAAPLSAVPASAASVAFGSTTPASKSDAAPSSSLPLAPVNFGSVQNPGILFGGSSSSVSFGSNSKSDAPALSPTPPTQTPSLTLPAIPQTATVLTPSLPLSAPISAAPPSSSTPFSLPQQTAHPGLPFTFGATAPSTQTPAINLPAGKQASVTDSPGSMMDSDSQLASSIPFPSSVSQPQATGVSPGFPFPFGGGSVGFQFGQSQPSISTPIAATFGSTIPPVNPAPAFGTPVFGSSSSPPPFGGFGGSAGASNPFGGSSNSFSQSSTQGPFSGIGGSSFGTTPGPFSAPGATTGFPSLPSATGFSMGTTDAKANTQGRKIVKAKRPGQK